jgi:hypothetical protein
VPFAISLTVALGGCGNSERTTTRPSQPTRSALTSYIMQIEPIRLAVNRLLNTADPILHASRKHRITAQQAARKMGQLERRFAQYTVDVQAIQPTNPTLQALHAQYAHTYILEDAYLSALVTGLADRQLDGLPNTQAEQRAAIIAWRTGLSVLARETNTHLPADLQQRDAAKSRPTPAETDRTTPARTRSGQWRSDISLDDALALRGANRRGIQSRQSRSRRRVRDA